MLGGLYLPVSTKYLSDIAHAPIEGFHVREHRDGVLSALLVSISERLRGIQSGSRLLGVSRDRLVALKAGLALLVVRNDGVPDKSRH